MALYPTKTRVALLRAVAAGDVIEDMRPDGTGTYDTTGAEDGAPARVVTARIEELMRAGWVDLTLGDAVWHLTDAGKAVLGGAR